MKTPLLANDYNLVETEIDLKEDENEKDSLVRNTFEKTSNNTKRTSTFRGKSVSFDSNFGNNFLNSNVNISNHHNHSLISDSSLTRNSQPIKLQMLDKTKSNNNLVYCSTSVNNIVQNSFVSPQSIRSVNLNGTSSALLCRICYAADNLREPLLQPCNCSGTMGLMHQKCLEKWLSQSNSNRCEICNFEFSIKKIPRSFRQWLFRPLTTKDTKNLFNDFVCFLILTPLAYISTWYCVLFALRFHEAENKWEASGLVVLTTFLLFIYILWFLFSCKYHYKVFKEWQEKNQIVTLKLSEENINVLNCNLYSCPQTAQTQVQAQTLLQSHVVNEVLTKLDNKETCQNSNTSQHQPSSTITPNSDLKHNESDSLYVKTKTNNNNNQSQIENDSNDQCLA